jgi:DNA repair and recombination protein RAD52
MFTDDQIKQLQAPLDRARVKQREGANRQTLSYLEAWDIIETANRIVGFGGWSRETTLLEPIHEPRLVPDQDPTKTKVVAAYLAKVRITVYSPDGQRSVVREGCGAARSFAKTMGEAVELAVKASESNAMKRALATFGSQTGLALYDVQMRNVAALPRETGRKPALDEGFDAPQRLTTSQRAIAATRRPNGRATDSELPV